MAEVFQEAMLLECVNFTWLTKIEKMKLSNWELDNLNRLLELSNQDLGQMQMYVNYYDRYEKIEGENPTIGILLCKQSDEALVDLTLPENANIYAKEYKLYLPDKKLLQKKLKEWLDEEQN